MATKKLVPRATNEGGLGTALKVWGPSWLQNLTITNLQTSISASILVETSGNVEKRDAGGLCGDVTDTESPTTWVSLYVSATGCLRSFTDEQFRYNALLGVLYLGGTLSTDSLSLWSQNIWSHADFKIEAGNTSSITLSSLSDTTFFTGAVGAAVMNINSTGLFINNIPTESAPVNMLVDTVATPGLISLAPITSLNSVIIESFLIACSDETSSLTAGTAKATFRIPYNFTLTNVRASVNTAPTGAVITVDINDDGTTMLSTKLTIDATEKTSVTAAIVHVLALTPQLIVDDSEITIDIDQIGSTVAGTGLKVILIGHKT